MQESGVWNQIVLGPMLPMRRTLLAPGFAPGAIASTSGCRPPFRITADAFSLIGRILPGLPLLGTLPVSTLWGPFCLEGSCRRTQVPTRLRHPVPHKDHYAVCASVHVPMHFRASGPLPGCVDSHHMPRLCLPKHARLCSVDSTCSVLFLGLSMFILTLNIYTVMLVPALPPFPFQSAGTVALFLRPACPACKRSPPETSPSHLGSPDQAPWHASRIPLQRRLGYSGLYLCAGWDRSPSASYPATLALHAAC